MDGRFSGGEGEIISSPMSSEHGEAAASVQHGICELPSPGLWRIGHGKKRNHQHQYQHYLLSCSSGGRLKVTSPWGGAMGPSRSTRDQHGVVVNVILGKRKKKLDVKPHPLQYLMRRVRERGEEKREYFRTIVHIVGSHLAVSCEHGCMIDSFPSGGKGLFCCSSRAQAHHHSRSSTFFLSSRLCGGAIVVTGEPLFISHYQRFIHYPCPYQYPYPYPYLTGSYSNRLSGSERNSW